MELTQGCMNVEVQSREAVVKIEVHALEEITGWLPVKTLE